MTRTLSFFCLLSIFFAAQPAWSQPTSENNARLKKGLKDYPEADTDGDGILTLKEARVFLKKAAGEENGKGGRGRGYKPRRGTVDGQYFAPLVQWSHETEEGAAKSKSPPAPPISMLRQKGGPSKWTIFRTSASPSFQLQH